MKCQDSIIVITTIPSMIILMFSCKTINITSDYQASLILEFSLASKGESLEEENILYFFKEG